MTEQITLSIDSPLLGEYDQDGVIIKRPEFDIEGRSIKSMRSILRVKNTLYFVVLPSGYNRAIEVSIEETKGSQQDENAKG